MNEVALSLQRPSIQSLFDGYDYRPFGAGLPIRIPVPKKLKPVQWEAECQDTAEEGAGAKPRVFKSREMPQGAKREQGAA
mmetsp:Transcript_30574/g.40667  ORF Transcript_30574/g.40667 Transcript_30574/m.40667 type:complete len:80 (+) Transcript_30574:1050-1289(+)